MSKPLAALMKAALFVAVLFAGFVWAMHDPRSGSLWQAWDAHAAPSAAAQQ